MKSRISAHLWASLKNHGSLMLVTVLVLTGCFFVSGGLILTGQNLQKFLSVGGDSLQVSVYLKDEATEHQAKSLGEVLKQDIRVGQAEWVDRDMAMKSFQDQMASYAPD